MNDRDERSYAAFRIFISRSDQGFQISTAALRQALDSGADTIVFTAPDGFRFGSDRRLHPDASTQREHSGRPEDQEKIMSNDDDERDYAEEQFNRHLLDDEEDPGDVPGTRVIVFRVPVRAGAHITDEMALGDINRIIIRAWRRLTPMSDLAGPVTVIPDASPLDQVPPWHTGPEWSGWRRSDLNHRAIALHLAGMAERSDPEFVSGMGFAGLIHAVLALSAPATPDSTWRQRAVEAEAALTAIGGIVSDPRYPGNKKEDIEHILRESGKRADKLMNAPAGPIVGDELPGAFDPFERGPE